jgi:hypothetical protein
LVRIYLSKSGKKEQLKLFVATINMAALQAFVTLFIFVEN